MVLSAEVVTVRKWVGVRRELPRTRKFFLGNALSCSKAAKLLRRVFLCIRFSLFDNTKYLWCAHGVPDDRQAHLGGYFEQVTNTAGKLDGASHLWHNASFSDASNQSVGSLVRHNIRPKSRTRQLQAAWVFALHEARTASCFRAK